MRKVLIVVNMQNDNCSPKGIYSKQGLIANNLLNIIPNVIETIHFCKKTSIPTIATQLTILKDLDNNSIGLGSYKNIRPFLEKEGFRENTWGHDILEELPKIDYTIKKWGISAFHQTELEHYLQALQCEEIIITGFTTNGSVETLAREAFGRAYKITTLTDCVTAYSEALHQSSLTNLGCFGKTMPCQDWIKEIELQINNAKQPDNL